MDKLTKFLLAIGVQIVIIFFIIIFKMAVLTGGTEVILRIDPVDPTSPLRGDYATIQYTGISNPYSYLAGSSQIKNGDTVYVILRKSGKYWTASSIQITKPSKSNQIFLRGKVASGGLERQSDLPKNQRPVSSQIRVVYGIEEYFIPEGKGRDFRFGNKMASARIVVDDNGNAVLKGIIVDGKPWP